MNPLFQALTTLKQAGPTNEFLDQSCDVKERHQALTELKQAGPFSAFFGQWLAEREGALDRLEKSLQEKGGAA